MSYTNMETRDPVLPSSCAAVFCRRNFIVHHHLPSCFMAFYSCQVTFYAFFVTFNAMNINIFQYKCSVCDVCLNGLFSCQNCNQSYSIRNDDLFIDGYN